MTQAAPDLNALLGSRICHDLISPLGAIGNGLELLAMSGLDRSPEMALITESVENANARVRFFRVAYGSASEGQEIGRTEIRSILRALSVPGRLSIDWIPEDHPLRAETKLAFLLIQCLETAMPWGGAITVTREGTRWIVAGRADRIKPLPELWPILLGRGDDTAVIAAQVHFPLARHAAADIRRRIAFDTGDAAVALSF